MFGPRAEMLVPFGAPRLIIGEKAGCGEVGSLLPADPHPVGSGILKSEPNGNPVVYPLRGG